MTDPVLECQELVKRFRTRGRDVEVLSGASLAVGRGEVVLVTGKSGTGKTTLLHLLAGLERPTSGSVRCAGRALESLPSSELAAWRRAEVGIVFQSHNLLPAWTAYENVEAALLHTGMAPAARRQRVTALLEQLGLGDRLGNLPAELSAGQQQRVAVARALIQPRSLLLADEPTGDVDPETAEEITNLLLAPVREHGTALVIATHGLFPPSVADRVVELREGRLSPLRDARQRIS